MALIPAIAPLLAFIALSLVAVIAALVLTLTGRLAVHKLLTPREWLLVGKLLAIVLLGALAIQVHNLTLYNSEQFIYGRF